MFKKRKKQILEPINTTSTADISFILLVFFLVITSMDTDKGLIRQLPPPDNSHEQEIADVEKKNLMTLELTAEDRLLVDGEPTEASRLSDKVMAFIDNKADRAHHIISIDINRHSSYEAYFKVQNEISAAYNMLRNKYTMRHYGKPYAQCTAEQREKARGFYPQRIAESISETGKGGEE